MPLPVYIVAIRLFLRLLLGMILLSVGISKLTHPKRFQRGIQDYQVLPPSIEAVFSASAILAFGISVAEIVTGLGLIMGLLLLPAILLAAILMLIFSIAMSLNLVRGRSDLSCHCGGAIGDHRIS